MLVSLFLLSVLNALAFGLGAVYVCVSACVFVYVYVVVVSACVYVVS